MGLVLRFCAGAPLLNLFHKGRPRRKTEPLNFEEMFLDEGWQRSSSQMPPSSAQSSKCNVACFFIVCNATIATISVMTMQRLRTHTEEKTCS